MVSNAKRALVGIALGLISSTGVAANYPDQPIRLVIPYAAGGPTDVLGRMVAEQLGREFDQSVIVENKAGAAGLVAMGQIARAKPDGYTLLMGDMNLAVSPALHKNLSFDPVKDFTPIEMIATAPMLMLVPVSSPAKTAQEYVALAKAEPGKFAYASAGIGSPTHLATEVLKERYGLDLTHIPYQGAGPALTSLAAGDTGLMFTGLSAAKPLVEAGKLRALAITGDKRSPVMPDVPTLKEANIDLPELSVGSWWGILTPAGVSPEVAAQLKGGLNKALASPELKARLSKLNYTQPPEGTDFSDWIAKETGTWTAVMKKAGIQPE